MNQPLRVTLITNNYIPYGGGVVSSLTVLINELQKKGHVVDLITLDFLGDAHQDSQYVFRVPCPLKYVYKKNHIAVPWRSDHYVLEHIQKFKPDIVHVHHPFLLGESGLRAAKKIGLPVVFTYHTMYEEYEHYIPFFSKLTKIAIKHIVKTFCVRVDHIIAPSSYIENQIKTQNIKTPVSVIPSAIKDYFVQDKTMMKPLSYPIILLSVGRFAKEKNLTFLIDVVVMLGSPYKLILVGYGAYYEYLQWYAYTKYNASQDLIAFIIQPSQKELVELYRNAYIFLFSSTTDTQGLVLAEAMSSGLPIVALDGPGQRDSIQHGINGYLVYSKKDMIEKVNVLRSNQLMYQRFSKSAQQIARKYFPDVFSNRIVQLYQLYCEN